MEQSLASKKQLHATWMRMALYARRNLIWTAVKYPASGQERNF